MFKPKIPFNQSSDVIIWDVPYYPQKDVCSCWYYGVKMMIHAYFHDFKNKKRLKPIMDFRGYFWQIDRLNIRDEKKFYENNDFFVRKFNSSALPLDVLFDSLFEIISRQGPVLHIGGHVYPIVGANKKTRTVYVHYTLPLVFNTHSPTEENPRFWSGHGKHPERQRAISRKRTSPVDDWFEEANYLPITKPWEADSKYPQVTHNPAHFAQEYEDIPDKFFNPAQKTGLEGVDRFIENEIKLKAKRFYVASKLFSPDVLKTTAYLEIPFDYFIKKMMIIDGLFIQNFEIAYFNPQNIEKFLQSDASCSSASTAAATTTSCASSSSCIATSCSPPSSSIDEIQQLQTDEPVERPLIAHKSAWTKFKDAPSCQVCGFVFKFTIRPHHCRQCGKVICQKCSGVNPTVPDPTWKAHLPRHKTRVCQSCLNFKKFI